jgi:hypothetical protein
MIGHMLTIIWFALGAAATAITMRQSGHLGGALGFTEFGKESMAQWHMLLDVIVAGLPIAAAWQGRCGRRRRAAWLWAATAVFALLAIASQIGFAAVERSQAAGAIDARAVALAKLISGYLSEEMVSLWLSVFASCLVILAKPLFFGMAVFSLPTWDTPQDLGQPRFSPAFSRPIQTKSSAAVEAQVTLAETDSAGFSLPGQTKGPPTAPASAPALAIKTPVRKRVRSRAEKDRDAERKRAKRADPAEHARYNESQKLLMRKKSMAKKRNNPPIMFV